MDGAIISMLVAIVVGPSDGALSSAIHSPSTRTHSLSGFRSFNACKKSEAPVAKRLTKANDGVPPTVKCLSVPNTDNSISINGQGSSVTSMFITMTSGRQPVRSYTVQGFRSIDACKKSIDKVAAQARLANYGNVVFVDCVLAENIDN